MKRIISLFLVIVLAMGLMSVASGCKKNTDANTSLLNGVNIRIASWGSAKPVVGTEDGDLKLAAIEAACKKYGCTVQWFDNADMTQKLLTAATTGSVVAEVIMQRAHRVLELQMKDDCFWALDDLDGQPNKEIYNTDTTKHTTYNGKTYGFWYDPTNINVMMAINKDVIARAGVEIPYNLVEDRKWTAKAWTDLMLKTANPDEEIYGGSVFNVFGFAMLHANNTSLYTEKNGTHLANTDSSDVIEIAEILQNAVINDKTLSNNIGAGPKDIINGFINGKYATISVGRADCRDNLSKNMTDGWGIMPIPIGPAANEYVKLDFECKTFAIQKAVDFELAKAILKFMDETYECPIDGMDAMRSMYRAFAPDEESLEILMLLQELPLTLMVEYTTPDLRNFVGKDMIFEINKVFVGSKSIKSSMDSLKPLIQGILDDFYDQGE